ncbi:MAG: hypothetical protein ABSA21_08350 [Candidatus Limnocylindrales bacterium]|jgi:hypothetical protein
MEIISEHSHRVLAFLIAVEDQGYHPTVAEIDTWDKGPDPWTRVSSPFLSGLTNELLFGGLFRQTVESESASSWLVRVKLAELRGERLRATTLGRALLAAANERRQTLESSPAIAVVLKQDDEFALATVMAKIAEAGPAALIDPYLGAEEYFGLVRHTSVKRIITGDKNGDRLKALSAGRAYLGQNGGEAAEIRVTNAFHDRYVIPEKGSIWMLGTSLNGVGKRTSMMVQVPDNPGGRAIRDAFEEEWGKAKSVADCVATEQPDHVAKTPKRSDKSHGATTS